jgi:hypothetical protein
MRRLLQISGHLHLTLLIVSIAAMATNTAFIDALKITLVSLSGVILSYSLLIHRNSIGVNRFAPFVIAILIYALSFSIYYQPSFLRYGWNIVIVLFIAYCLISLVKALKLGLKLNRIIYLAGVIIIMPILFKLTSPYLYAASFIILVLTTVISTFIYWRDPK